MKKILYAAVALLAATSCKDDNLIKPGTGSDDGDVKIIVSLKDSPLTRTLYGQEETVDGKSVFPIYWSDNDTVLLASPQCDVKEATYVIEGFGTASAEAMTKVGDAGLQWGSAQEADFYSVYPRSFTMNGKVFTNTLKVKDEKTTATLNVRNYQMVKFTFNEETTTYEGVCRDDDPNTSDICEYPDAIMYAQRHMSEQGDVYLQYIPFTTAFHVELDGYQWEWVPPSEDSEITIEEITVTANTKQVIAGVFNAEFQAPDAEGNFEAPTVTVPKQTISNPNVIHIIPISGDDDGLLSLKKDQKLSFNFFAIPNPAVTSADGWTITVKTTNGIYTRTISTTGTTDLSAALTPGKIHSMHFPKFNVMSDFTFNVNDWMRDIPRNVYTSQISIPGAWYATQSEYQSDTDIATLWSKGVRAFAVETRSAAARYSSGSNANPTQVLVSGSGTGSVGGPYRPPLFGGAVTIQTVMKKIIAEVQKKNYGYAVLAISYALGGDGGHRAKDYSFWLEGLRDAYNSLSDTEKAVIYQDRIGHATTIGELAGKLIVYVNVSGSLPVDGSNELGSITVGNLNPDDQADFPFMYYYVDRKREGGESPIVQMHTRWMDEYNGQYALKNTIGNQENETEVKTALLTDLKTDNLYVNYVNANRTYNTDLTNVGLVNPENTLLGGTNADDLLPTYVARKQAILRILRNSNIMQDEGRTNMRYFIGAGGIQAESNSSSTDAVAFARVMNPWILNRIYNEINNKTFSPFGMVFCNFITQSNMTLSNSYTYPAGSSKAGQSTTSFDNNEIILGIVKMNRLFYLLRDPDQPETVETTPSNSPARSSFNSTHTSAGNAWEVEY